MLSITSKEELRSWMNIDSSVNVQMPNEIFDDFGSSDFKSFNHKCFAYAYYYLVSYLYRNTLYGNTAIIDDVYSQKSIIKVMTTDIAGVSYITKRGGLLDEINYTKTTSDYPVQYYIEDGILDFDMIKSLRSGSPNLKMEHNPKFAVKEPVKALVRFDDEDFTGTFYSFQNTHRIDSEKFIDIITDSKLGHVGLYVYAYLSMMFDKFPMGYTISNKDLCEMIGCSERTANSYTNKLEQSGLLTSSRKKMGNKMFEKSYYVK